MPVLTLTALRKTLASGRLERLYLLVGADDTEKTAVAHQIADVVDEGLQAFNVDRLRGGEATVDDLITAASLLPMMAPTRVVLVLDAERLLVPKRESKAAEADQERLEAFLADSPAGTAIVFVGGALDQRRRIVKWLMKEAQVVDCGTIVDVEDAARWVQARAARDKVPLDAGAVQALVERGGADLVRLRAALERVALYALGQKTITASDVRESVSQGPESQADCGVAKAIWRNDTKDALHELGLVLDAGGAPMMMLGQLRAAAEKLPSGRVPAAIDALLRTDIALKSSGGDPRALLERLVVELCGSARGGRDPRSATGHPARGAQAGWRRGGAGARR